MKTNTLIAVAALAFILAAAAFLMAYTYAVAL